MPADVHAVDRAPARRAATAVSAAGLVAGLVLFCDLALHLFGGLGRGYFLLAGLVALGLAGVPTALWLRGAFTPGGGRILAVVGSVLVGLGVALWLTAFVWLAVEPAAAFTQRLTPGGSSLMALGMIVVGVAVLGSGRARGWRAAAPLAVGLYFPLQLGVQLAFFLGGRDADPGPNGVLLGAWGLLWATCALTTARPAPPRPVRTGR